MFSLFLRLTKTLKYAHLSPKITYSFFEVGKVMYLEN